MGTLSIKVSSGNLESYEALFLQLPDPATVAPVEKLELVFGDVTQVFPSAYGLLASYLACTRDRSKRPLITRRFGANPQSAKLERAMDAIGFVPAVLGEKPPPAKPTSGIVPLLAIRKETPPDQVANKVLETVLAVAQPTRDAKESLFVAITELVENVLRHAQAETPAFLCGQLSAQKRKLELVLADAGIGIRQSLEGGKDSDAVRRIQAGESPLALALEPGRTSKGEGNTGYGLWVSGAATRINRGVFRVTSGTETTILAREGDKHRTHANWRGTIINLMFNLDKLGALGEVYRSLPLTMLEPERFLAAAETAHEGGETVVTLKADSPYLGSREAASRARVQLHEAVRSGKTGVADSEGVLALAPAYADECFGELLAAVGETPFRRSVIVRNANDAARALIEAVLQRRARPRDFAAPPPSPPAANAIGAAAPASAAPQPAEEVPAAGSVEEPPASRESSAEAEDGEAPDGE